MPTLKIHNPATGAWLADVSADDAASLGQSIARQLQGAGADAMIANV